MCRDAVARHAMGGKKKKATIQLKKDSKFKIPANFDCPLCDAKRAIKVRVFRKEGQATVQCRACKKPDPPFVSKMNRLSEPHDAFFEYYERVHQQDSKLLAAARIATRAPEIRRAADEMQVTAAPRSDDEVDGESDDGDSEVQYMLQ